VAGLVLVLLEHGWRVVPRTRLHVAVGGLALVSLVAALFAAQPYVALFGEQDRYLGLTFLGDMLVLYLSIAIAVRTAGDVAVLLGAIAVAGAVASGYALLQLVGADPFTWATDPRSRPFATIGNPDQLGHLISVLFGVAAGAAIGATGHGSRAIAVAGAIATLGVAAFVATRGTLLGIACALASAVAMRPSRRSILATAAIALAIAGALLATPLGQRAVETARSGTLPDRITLYGIAWRATLERPFFGYGPDNFRAAFVEHRTAESLANLSAAPETSAHDWLLDASTTTGLIGLAALLVLVTLGSIELVRLARMAPAVGLPLAVGWAAYWANALVDVGSVAVAWFPWVAVGVAAALRGSRPQTVATRRLPRWLRPAIAIVAVVGMASGTRAFIANEETFAAAEAMHFGDRDAAVALADRAAARDPGRADHWNRLGLALESQRRWADAAVAYREAAGRERYEPVYWANLARALARTGAQDDALAAAREAAAVDPNAPIGHVTLSEIAATFGRCELARGEASRAAALESGHEELVARAAACR